MNWRFWRRAGAAGQNAKVSAAGSVISSVSVGQAVWTPREYDKLAEESYQRNAIAFRCVKMIASAAAAVPWMIKNGSDGAALAEDHPLATLLRRPAPNIAGQQFFEAVYSFLLLAGNAYIEATDGNVGGTRGQPAAPPAELWTHRPDRMRIVAGPYGLPQGYRYEANGRRQEWAADPVTGEGQILHIKDFHPLDDWYGMSRVEAAAYGIDRHNAASSHNKALLDNGMQPAGVLVVKPLVQGGMVIRAPDDLFEKIETRLKERHMGAANAGRPLILNGDVDWKQLSVSPREMDFNEGKLDSARDICVALGVPHILIVPGASTYNNVSQAKLDLYEETVIPLAEMMAGSLSGWIAPRYGDGIRIGIDLDAVSALEPRRETKRKATVEMFDKGLLTKDEAREALDYEPLSDAVQNRPDAAVLSALILAVQNGTLPIGPLRRYCVSVGLVDEKTTDEDLLAAAETEAEEHGDEVTDDQTGDDGANPVRGDADETDSAP